MAIMAILALLLWIFGANYPERHDGRAPHPVPDARRRASSPGTTSLGNTTGVERAGVVRHAGDARRQVSNRVGFLKWISEGGGQKPMAGIADPDDDGPADRVLLRGALHVRQHHRPRRPRSCPSILATAMAVPGVPVKILAMLLVLQRWGSWGC